MTWPSCDHTLTTLSNAPVSILSKETQNVSIWTICSHVSNILKVEWKRRNEQTCIRTVRFAGRMFRNVQNVFSEQLTQRRSCWSCTGHPGHVNWPFSSCNNRMHKVDKNFVQHLLYLLYGGIVSAQGCDPPVRCTTRCSHYFTLKVQYFYQSPSGYRILITERCRCGIEFVCLAVCLARKWHPQTMATYQVLLSQSLARHIHVIPASCALFTLQENQKLMRDIAELGTVEDVAETLGPGFAIAYFSIAI